MFLVADVITWIRTLLLDGKTLVTAAGQLKSFDCSNHKKIQKFTGHPVSVYKLCAFCNHNIIQLSVHVF